MRTPKKCACCGVVYIALPETGRIMLPSKGGPFAGYYAECACGSTLFWPWESFLAEIHVIDLAQIKGAA